MPQKLPPVVRDAVKLLRSLQHGKLISGRAVAECIGKSFDRWTHFAKHPALADYRFAKTSENTSYGNKRTVALARAKLEAEKSRPQPGVETSGPKEGFTFEEDGKSGVATSVSRDIRSVEDLLAYGKVDTSVWEVERYTLNKWEVVMREPATTVFNSDGSPLVTENEKGGKATLWTRRSRKPMHEPMYQIKVWLKRMVAVETARGLLTGMLNEFKKQAPKQKRISKPIKSGHLLEVSIFDLHLGKLAWKPESGTDYDLKIAQSGFWEALEALLERSKGFPIERIVFPIGNDFFNVDNMANETTAGTPQREDGRWQKSFVLGRKLMVDGINRLREIAPVDVIIIPGNHDMERVFYLGDALSGWLSQTADVSVDNSPQTRKYYQYGQNLIGYTHGKEEKHANLPLIMAAEEPAKWAATKFREFHIGHYHHKKEIHFQPIDEHQGIRVRQIPSLCPADDWHKLRGYNSLRAAEVHIWNKNQGCVGSFSFSPN